MGKENLQRVHWSFWLIGVLALIWNVMGGMNLLMQLSPETLANMPESHRTIAETRPVWAILAFAASVLGSILGCIFLLLRKKIAYYFFVVSLVGIFLTLAHAVLAAGALTVFSPFEIVLAIVSPFLLALFLIWYAKWTARKNWIA